MATAPDEEELKLRMELNRLAKEEYEMMVPPTHFLRESTNRGGSPSPFPAYCSWH